MNKEKWKILIVDDDNDTLFMLHNQLSNYEFDGKSIELLTAKSGNEAKKILDKNKYIVFLILEAVTKKKQKELDLVRYIREELKDKKMRIMICTGYSEEIPEQLLIQKYDINYYETKKNLTPNKLISKITLGLKEYKTIDNLLKLEKEYAIESEKFKQINSQFLEANSELEQIKDKANENLFKLEITLESGKADYWEMNLETRTLTYSKRWARFLGYEPGEVEETIEAISQIIHPEDYSNNTTALRNYIQGKAPIYESECRLKTKSGNWMWISSRGKAIEWNDKGQPIKLVGVNYDITERKKSEEALRESEEKYSELFHESIDGCALHSVICNENGHPIDYITIDVNAAYESIMKVKKEQVVGKKASEFLPKEELEKWLKIFGPIALNGGSQFYENYSPLNMKYFEGNVFSPKKKHFAVVFRDISEKKIAELQLLKREELHQSILQTAMDGFWRVDMNGKIIEVNNAYCQLSGYTPEEIIGKEISYFETEETPFEVKTHFNKIIEQGFDRFESKHRRKDGSIYDVENSVQYKPEGGYMVVFLRDITKNKQSENDLKQSETRFRELCDLLPQTIYEANLQGKLTYSNQRAFETFGYSLSDFENGINILDNIIPHEHIRVRESMKNMLDSKISQGLEYTCRRKNGSTFQAIIYSAPILINGQVNGFRGSIIDISEQKKSEKALIESEQKYRLLHENAGVGIGYYTPDGTIISFNTLASNYMKGKPEDFTGKSIFDIYPKQDAEFFLSRIRKAIIEDKPQQYTDYVVLPSGKKWFLSVFTRIQNDKNQTIGIQIISTDISAQKHAEEELTIAKEKAGENEKKYFTLFNEMINGFAYHKILLDESGIPFDYVFLSINPAFERLTGLKGENIIGRTVLDVLPQNEKYWIEIYGKVALTGESLTFENYSAAINKYYRVIAYSPEKEYFATIFEDITELKITENELIKAKEKAEESDRLKTAFLQNMSHEIRTPMNAIVGFSSRLNKGGLSDEKRKSFTKIITDSSRQLLNVVNDILTISSIDTRLEKINPENVNLTELFSELLSIFRAQALLKRTIISFKVPENQKIDELFTDKTKLTQIITNLITNALKFTQEGTIEFGYELVKTGNDLSQPYLQFYVKDTGIGIEPEMQQKIFERFRQANLSINKNYGGTGLGLSISKGFVELLGGKIWVESELGKGSTFYFTLPYVNVIHDIVKETPDIQPETIPTILVVEDEEYNYMLIEEILIGMKYSCLRSRNGHESVELCKANNNIDLVLMDIKMPVMDGHTAAQLIKKLRPNLPVIAQTAYALNIEIERYKGAFDDYITKPIKENELFEKLKVHLSIQ